MGDDYKFWLSQRLYPDLGKPHISRRLVPGSVLFRVDGTSSFN